MHIRRLATLLLGAWLAGSFFMALVATHNLAAVDRLMASPPRQVAISLELLSEPIARSFFQYQAAELNRWYFETWEWAQMPLGLSLMTALVLSGRQRSGLTLCALMLACVLLMRFVLTPQVVRFGRLVEFVPLGQRAAERTQFWRYHAAYLITEASKVLIGLILASSLLRRHDSRRSSSADDDAKWARAK